MKNKPLPFRPIVLLVLLAACRAHGDSATWTGAAAVPDNLWPTLGNWTAGITSVPGTNPGESATFSDSGIAGLDISVPAIEPPATTLATVKFLNFNGLSQHTFALPVVIEDGGAVTVDAGTAAQTLKLTIAGNGTITNNSNTLLTTALNFTAATAGQLLTFGGPGDITISAAMQSLGPSVGGFVKNGSGTLSLPSGSNSNITGGFTINAGKIVSAGNNTMGNKILTLNGGFLEMTTNAQTNYTGASVNGNFTISLGGINNQWTFGATSGTIGALTSTNNPVLTIQTVPPVPVPPATATSYLTMGLNTSAYDGTFKIGGAASGGSLMIGSTVAVGGPKVRVELGEAGVAGLHLFGNTTTLSSGTNIVPVVIGELKGANTTALLAGKRQLASRTTGTRYEVGALGTSTSFSGSIVDGVSEKSGTRMMNGNPDCSASVAPDTATTYSRLTGAAAGAQGTVEFVKTGAGTLTLLSNNTYSGGTVFKGGLLAVSSDAALGAAYDGTLRPFSLIPGATNYALTDLPDAVIAGGNPTVPASVGLFSTQPQVANASNNLYLSFSSQANDSDAGNIVNTATGSGYTSVPVISFTGGTPVTEPATPPVATVRVKGLLTFDGGTLRTNAGITSNRATVLEVGGGTIDTNGFDSTFSGIFNGAGSLTKTGTGKLSLTGANTYTGDTNVSAGILAVNGTSIGNAAKLSITGGKVEPTGNETVGTLFINGLQKDAGTYGASGSLAGTIDDTHFSGSAGIVTVTTGSAGGGGYTGWATANAPGQTPSQDYDNDGVQNGTEYFMNSAAGFTSNPPVVTVGAVRTVTWLNGGNIPSSAYGTQFVVQTSTNLVNWAPILSGDPNLSNTAGSVVYTLTGTGIRFARLVVTPN